MRVFKPLVSGEERSQPRVPAFIVGLLLGCSQCTTDEQSFLGPRHRNVEQPPLFVDLGRAAAQANRNARKTFANVPSPSPEFDRLEIQHFFEVYKDLEPGKSVEGATWVGRTEAEKEIHESWARYDEAPGH